MSTAVSNYAKEMTTPATANQCQTSSSEFSTPPARRMYSFGESMSEAPSDEEASYCEKQTRDSPLYPIISTKRGARNRALSSDSKFSGVDGMRWTTRSINAIGSNNHDLISNQNSKNNKDHNLVLPPSSLHQHNINNTINADTFEAPPQHQHNASSSIRTTIFLNNFERLRINARRRSNGSISSSSGGAYPP